MSADRADADLPACGKRNEKTIEEQLYDSVESWYSQGEDTHIAGLTFRRPIEGPNYGGRHASRIVLCGDSWRLQTVGNQSGTHGQSTSRARTRSLLIAVCNEACLRFWFAGRGPRLGSNKGLSSLAYKPTTLAADAGHVAAQGTT